MVYPDTLSEVLHAVGKRDEDERLALYSQSTRMAYGVLTLPVYLTVLAC